MGHQLSYLRPNLYPPFVNVARANYMHICFGELYDTAFLKFLYGLDDFYSALE